MKLIENRLTGGDFWYKIKVYEKRILRVFAWNSYFTPFFCKKRKNGKKVVFSLQFKSFWLIVEGTILLTEQSKRQNLPSFAKGINIEMEKAEIVLLNLFENEENLSRLSEIRLSCLSDLAELLSFDSSDWTSDEDLDHLREVCYSIRDEWERFYRRIEEKVPLISRPALRNTEDDAYIRSAAQLCQMMSKQTGILLQGKTLERDCRISYFHTQHLDRAYQIFSREFSHIECFRAENFEASCEEVYSGNCDFCILPMEDSEEGSLLPFLRLAEKYELFVCLACDLPDKGDKKYRFCLLGQGIRYSEEADLADFTIPVESSRLWQTLAGIHQIGGMIEQVIALPLSLKKEESYRLRIRLSQNLFPLHLFLRLSQPGTVLEGVYKLVPSSLADEKEEKEEQEEQEGSK